MLSGEITMLSFKTVQSLDVKHEKQNTSKLILRKVRTGLAALQMPAPEHQITESNMGKSWLKFPRPRNPTAEEKLKLTHQSFVWTMVREEQGVDIPVGKQAVQLHQLRRDPRKTVRVTTVVHITN